MLAPSVIAVAPSKLAVPVSPGAKVWFPFMFSLNGATHVPAEIETVARPPPLSLMTPVPATVRSAPVLRTVTEPAAADEVRMPLLVKTELPSTLMVMLLLEATVTPVPIVVPAPVVVVVMAAPLRLRVPVPGPVWPKVKVCPLTGWMAIVPPAATDTVAAPPVGALIVNGFAPPAFMVMVEAPAALMRASLPKNDSVGELTMSGAALLTVCTAPPATVIEPPTLVELKVTLPAAPGLNT